MTWGITVLSIIGTVGNIYQLKWCFYVWLFTNIAWAVVDYRKKIWAQVALQVVYAGLAVWGILRW